MATFRLAEKYQMFQGDLSLHQLNTYRGLSTHGLSPDKSCKEYEESDSYSICTANIIITWIGKIGIRMKNYDKRFSED